MNEEQIKQEILNRFALEARVQRTKRIFVDVDGSKFRDLLTYAYDELKFQQLCAITGLDEGENLAALYHLTNSNGIVLSLKTFAPRNNPIFMTVTDIFPSAEIYEREMVDLLGFKVEGLKLDTRYPLTDDWPVGQFPLRKDWQKEATHNG
jgi:NADH:ubiquinone oxidoreductase subunit C